MNASGDSKPLPKALSLLSSERPRNVSWFQAGALLFGDWGTSRLYVLGLAFLVAGRSSFWLIAGMSLLILAVGWAYTQICRIYADGGGVYTAGRQRSAIVGVIGALLLFADYTVTASLSAVEGFHYFGAGKADTEQVQAAEPPAGDDIRRQDETLSGAREPLIGPGETALAKLWASPGLLGILAIVLIGGLNLLGPKHSAGFALFAAVGMIVITLLIVVFALPQIDWRHLQWGRLWQAPDRVWYGFVYIVLALSGVEAIANLTGVMKRPVYKTAQRSIWLCAIEVAVFNLLLALIMISLDPGREAHKEDMLAYMARQYIGPWGEWPVRILGGLLLLSATNTAIGALTGTIYVMSRDDELPRVFQGLNPFGAPWLATFVATVVPVSVLLFVHDLTTLASMYAIGVVGAVAINCSLTTFHPRLRKWYRKAAMAGLGLLLIAIWLTLAFTKWHATAFVAIVLTIGLTLRGLTKYAQTRRPKPSLLRQAIIEQLPADAMARPKLLLATAGSDSAAGPALRAAKAEGAALVVSFVREVALNYKVTAETQLSLETDSAAQALFTDFLEHGYKAGVPIIPAYDTSENAPEQIAELAAMYGVDKVLIGSSRRGAIHQFIKGNFQKRLEAMLPPEIPVKVLQMDGKA
ncbi:MAG: amino acid permease [Phycisphaerales bacterium]|nr:amino acid permease [Phycisphaerales bacterium]